MKNKIFYLLLVMYVVIVGFVLYINGVYPGGTIGNLVNLVINIVFLVVIGILFVISTVSFSRLNRSTKQLVEAADKIQQEYAEKGKNLWTTYQNKTDLFESESLAEAFSNYQDRMQTLHKKGRYIGECDIEDYMNENLIDRIGMSFFNSGMSGTLTGLGILGTFVGLSIGLNSFSGNDIYTISDNVGPLLGGMKVAFHTSVYGIFFSLIFNFMYRSIMSDAYEKLDYFLMTFKQCVVPVIDNEDESASAMLVYQSNIVSTLKQMLALQQGISAGQVVAVEKMVEQFTQNLSDTMGIQFQQFGKIMQETNKAQQSYANSSKTLIDIENNFIKVNHTMQENMKQMMTEQEALSKHITSQETKITETCDAISDEMSNQLYTFIKTRDSYEK